VERDAKGRYLKGFVPPTAFKKGHRESAESNEKRRLALIAAHENGKFGFLKEQVPWNKGLPWSEEIKAKVGRSRKGIKAGNHRADLNGIVTRFRKDDPRLVTHHLTKHPLKSTHALLVKRCCDPSGWAYSQYGGANPPVDLYELWKDITTFIFGIEALLGPRPEKHTLDRINPWEGYYPWNVRWADAATQKNNQRQNIPEYLGQSGEH
jgi:hypothetical protein